MTIFVNVFVLLFAVPQIIGFINISNPLALSLNLLFLNPTYDNISCDDSSFRNYKTNSISKNIEEHSETIRLEMDYNDGFIYVEGGTFFMGSDNGDVDERPIHKITIKSFYIGRYEVTQKEWWDIMGNNPSRFKGKSLPVEQINWFEIQKFIIKLNKKSGRIYRLPTEAEWEYAACNANLGLRHRFSGSDNIDEVSWYLNNSEYKTHPVGTKQPNALGIYDMSGNVGEWCSDWYDKDYYLYSPNKNPQGPSSGKMKTVRGGSWTSLSNGSCRVTYRDEFVPVSRFDYLGFRLCRDM